MNLYDNATAGRTLIIGFGDPLHGDDGVGWQVASLLAASLENHEIDIRIAMQLTPDMLEPISHADLVLSSTRRTAAIRASGLARKFFQASTCGRTPVMKATRCG